MGLGHYVASRIKRYPLLWWLAWEGSTRFPWLLPHEQSYFGFPHFAKQSGGLIEVRSEVGDKPDEAFALRDPALALGPAVDEQRRNVLELVGAAELGGVRRA